MLCRLSHHLGGSLHPYLQAIQWSLNGQSKSAEDLSVNGDASSTPRLLSNLSTWEIGTIKNGALQRVGEANTQLTTFLNQGRRA
jgi:hypothetical protein